MPIGAGDFPHGDWLSGQSPAPVPSLGVTDSTTTPVAAPDVQAGTPATQVSLSRVGVTGVEKVIRVQVNGSEHLYFAELECFVDLNPQQAGVHMSRFEEDVGEAIDRVVLGEAPFRAETLAAHIAERVRESQRGLRAEVSVDGALPGDCPHPGVRPDDAGDLHALRHRRRLRARHPHPDRRPGPGHDRLPLRAGDGGRPRPRAPCRARALDEAEIDEVIESVPVATHNQRGIGTL